MEEKLKEMRKLPAERLALRLKAYRVQYGMTQEGLARRIGIKRSTLLRWENSKVRISNAFLRILVDEGII